MLAGFRPARGEPAAANPGGPYAPIAIPPRDVEDATLALKRVEPDIETQDPNDLSAMNVNVIEATSVVLGVVDGILSFRAES